MRIKGSPPFSILLSAIALLAALLRLWGPLADAQVRHPDEFHFVYWPLYFFSGDFNPQHTLTAFYPALHYYLLGLLYFAYFLLQFWPDGWSLAQFAAYHFFWGDAALLEIARWTGAAFAVGTVIWAGLLGRRVAGTAAGCMAALLVEDRPLRAPLGARGIR
jgi:hypothetical protein